MPILCQLLWHPLKRHNCKELEPKMCSMWFVWIAGKILPWDMPAWRSSCDVCRLPKRGGGNRAAGPHTHWWWPTYIFMGEEWAPLISSLPPSSFYLHPEYSLPPSPHFPLCPVAFLFLLNSTGRLYPWLIYMILKGLIHVNITNCFIALTFLFPFPKLLLKIPAHCKNIYWFPVLPTIILVLQTFVRDVLFFPFSTQNHFLEIVVQNHFIL